MVYSDEWLREHGYEPSYIHFHDLDRPPERKPMFTRDLFERVLATFLQAAGAEWLLTGSLDVETLKLAALAGLISVVKNFVGTKLPGTADDSGSWLPTQQDPPQP